MISFSGDIRHLIIILLPKLRISKTLFVIYFAICSALLLLCTWGSCNQIIFSHLINRFLGSVPIAHIFGKAECQTKDIEDSAMIPHLAVRSSLNLMSVSSRKKLLESRRKVTNKLVKFEFLKTILKKY
jgi:hypothetical protein